MPGTTIVTVPAGTTSPPLFLTPLHNLCAGPSVLGGLALIETGVSPNGPWLSAGAGANGAADSVRLPTNGYARVTAFVSPAYVIVSDMGASSLIGPLAALCTANASIATANAITNQKLFSLRIPPLFLPPNFRMEVRGNIALTNSATVKTVTCYVNAFANSFFTSPSLASNANYNFVAALLGKSSAVLQGAGAGATGGLGLSTAAYAAIPFDFTNNETEIVISVTKATGTDTATLESVAVSVYM